MSGNSRRRGGRTHKQKRGVGRDFWGADEAPETPEPFIESVEDPSFLIRSLGPPPLPGYETIAEHYFAAVFDKAARVGSVLALANDLLVEPDDED